MSGSVFLDSNVVVYSATSTEPVKQPIARALLLQRCCVSLQVVFESLNVLLKKMKLDPATALRTVRDVANYSVVVPEDEAVVRKALDLYSTGQFQAYDAKIVAAALLAGCTTLYSEDMKDGLTVEGGLTIVNPFLA